MVVVYILYEGVGDWDGICAAVYFLEGISVKPAQPVGCPYPDEAAAVLIQGHHTIVGQSVICVQMSESYVALPCRYEYQIQQYRQQ